MYDYYDPFNFYRGLYNSINSHNQSKPICRHQQTCPDCGRTLVNLYKKNGLWKCRLCWEEEEKAILIDK